MTNILIISTSPRGSQSLSRTHEATARGSLLTTFPDASISHLDLATEKMTFVDETWFTWNYNPDKSGLTAKQHAQATKNSLLADQLLAADYVVISTPVYNFNVPAALKAWIDHVVISGKTFDGRTYTGLATNIKELILITASNGDLDEYKRKGTDGLRPGIQGFANLIGVQKLTWFGFLSRQDEANAITDTKLKEHITMLNK
jgi:FMN-dependent NADH-azoreductase